MSESKTSKDASAATSAECPVCYETFQSPKVSRRMLSCGHAFCHDCLVKCLVASRDNGHFQNSLICPVCRFVTLLCRNRPCWPSKTVQDASSPELPLSPSSLSYGVPLASSNTLVVPAHFLMPFHGYSAYHNVCGCPSVNSVAHPGGLERESHIFTITRCGMPMIEENFNVITQGRNVEAPGSMVSRRSVAMGCCRSPIILAIFLVSAVTILGAVLPWLLVRKNE